MSKVFDCFLFSGELDVLEIRLNELDSVVDCFVICEARRTFTNQPKPLHFHDESERFSRFLPKIKYVIVEDFPATVASPSELESIQRNALAPELADCAADDIIIVSNADEVPNPVAIRTFEGPVSGLRMREFGYYLNLEHVAAPESTKIRSAMCRYEYLRSPQWLREFAQANHVSNKIVLDGGWRFAHLADVDWITRKLSALSLGVRSDPQQIRADIEAGALTLSRDDVWELVPVDTSYPAYLQTNQGRYQDLLGEPVDATRPLPGALSLYYEHERPDVLEMVPANARRVLEVGCATGGLGAALKRRQNCHVTGIEYAAEPAARARMRLDRVIVGDCEKLDLDALFQPSEFDCIIAADVLEHLREPEDLLRRLQTHLAGDASIVVSIPNVRHAGVLQGAVQGYWTYQDQGILDRTHLRFFTRREISSMFTRLGFEVDEHRAVVDPSRAKWEQLGRPPSPAFGALTVSGLNEAEIREFFVIQWLMRARSALQTRSTALTAAAVRNSEANYVETIGWDMEGMVPAMTVAQSEIQELRNEQVDLAEAYQSLSSNYACLRAQNEETGRRLADLEVQHQADVAQYDAEAAQYQAEVAQYQTELARYRATVARYQGETGQHRADKVQLWADLAILRRHYDDLTSSTSWRLTRPLRDLANGRAFLTVPVRRLVHKCASVRRIATAVLRSLIHQSPGHVSEHPKSSLDPALSIDTDVRAESDHRGVIPDPEAARKDAFVSQVRSVVPADATLLIATSGEQELLQLYGRRSWHFPQAGSGAYAGHDPADSTAAIAHLEALRMKGADFLLLAGGAMGWFDKYGSFRRHIAQHYRLATRLPDGGIVFSLRDERLHAAQRVSRFGALAALDLGTDDGLALLDWHTDLDLARNLQQHTVFTPPDHARVLPYLDHSVDVVAVRDPDRNALDEARRVAREAVVTFAGRLGQPGEAIDTHVEWMPDNTLAQLPSASIIVAVSPEETNAQSRVAAVLGFLPERFRGEVIISANRISDRGRDTLCRIQSQNAPVRVLSGNLQEAALLAKADVLIFVGEGALPLPDCMPMLLRTLRRFPDAGVVGGRVVGWDGRLCEAGGIVNADGTLQVLGPGCLEPDDPAYGFVREVDWCSRTLLATWRSVFEELAGFEVNYPSSLLQDSDYCLRVRRNDRRVYFQPASVVVRVDGNLGPTTDDPDGRAFAERWAGARDTQVAR